MTRVPRAALLAALLASCSPGEREASSGEASSEPAATAPAQGDGVVEIVARGLTLEGPSEIPSGWTTIRLRNESPMTHFALVERIPPGQSLETQQAEIAPVFQEGMDLLAAGDGDAALAKFGELPAWFGEIAFLGGPGLTAPGSSSEVTVQLEPGTYLLECYVKTAGVFHSYNPDPAVYGMVLELTVTGDTSGRAEPTSTLSVEISSADGIVTSGTPTAGEHVVAVAFVDQAPHENFVGHDVHLARIEDGVDLEALEQWMDWTQPDGLQTPAPVRFVGGLNEMPAGSTGYVHVTLEPGTYAWIAEVPGAGEKGMLRTFTVGAPAA